MPHDPSVVRARYALSVLRIIRDANFQEVIRLTRALASEYPHSDSPAKTIEFEVRAISAFKALDTSLNGIDGLPQRQWTIASEAAEAWLQASEHTD